MERWSNEWRKFCANCNYNLYGNRNQCSRLHEHSNYNHYGGYIANSNSNIKCNNCLCRNFSYINRRWSNNVYMERWSNEWRKLCTNCNYNLYGNGHECSRLHEHSNSNHCGECIANSNSECQCNNRLCRKLSYINRRWSINVYMEWWCYEWCEFCTNRNDNVYRNRNRCKWLHEYSNSNNYRKCITNGNYQRQCNIGLYRKLSYINRWRS